jgi:hypothetical protein
MRSLSRQLVIALILLGEGLTSAQTQSARIPATHGTSLAGTQVMLPDDLRGKAGVLVLGFSKSSGDVCKGWGQRLTASYRDSHDVTYYQLPVLASTPKLIRGVVVRSIKSGVPDAEQPHLLPIFTGEDEWRRLAKYANPDDAYVLVVDGEGRIQWQTSGKVSDVGFTALKQQVDALRGSAGSAAK